MVIFEAIVDVEMLMKLAPASVATAFANIVLPVPGSPNNNRPLYGCAKHAKNSVKQIHFLAGSLPRTKTSIFVQNRIVAKAKCT